MLLSDFKVLSFDCYGTLIDWESGIWAALQPLLGGNGRGRDEALAAFARIETRLEAEAPLMRYAGLLGEIHRRLAAEWQIAAGEALHRAFAISIGDWPAFSDTAAALRHLKQHFRLVVLSNVDHAGFAARNRRLSVQFDAVFTAEDIGSYKPNPRNFRHMLAALAQQGYSPQDLLHVARACFTTMRPRRRWGWRQRGSTGERGRRAGARHRGRRRRSATTCTSRASPR